MIHHPFPLLGEEGQGVVMKQGAGSKRRCHCDRNPAL
jgi:hypothetical protein